MLTLHFHGTTTIPLEADCLTPENLAGKSLAEIAQLPLQHGNRSAPLGDFFSIEGNGDDEQLLLEGDCRRVKWLGTKMTRGQITIHGDVGMHLGAEMTGGSIEVFGHADDWLGAEMRGGRIRVYGNAGHLAGGAYRGSPIGMRGGEILIDGNAGDEVGCSMRRGLIAVGGDTGAFPGASIIAGSVFIFGKPGQRPGAGMKRGSIVCCGAAPTLLPTFRHDCDYHPVFLQLYFRQLRRWGFEVPEHLDERMWRRYSGDLVALGKGEVLCITEPES